MLADVLCSAVCLSVLGQTFAKKICIFLFNHVQVVVEMIRVNKTQNPESEQNGSLEGNLSGKGKLTITLSVMVFMGH